MIGVDLLIVLAASAVAGCVDAMAGGGGLIQLPALFAAYPRELPATLLGTNKCASIFGTASAVARFARSVTIPWALLSPGLAVALAASLGGAVVATRVPPDLFRPLVPVLLLAVLVHTIARKDFGHHHAPRDLSLSRIVAAVGLIAAIGFYDGFFGPGTGTFFMLLFVRFFGYDFVNAAACARVLNVATNATALMWFGAHGHVSWPLGLGMAVFNVAGAQVGTRLALAGGSRLVRRVFIGVVLVLVAKTGYDASAGWITPPSSPAQRGDGRDLKTLLESGRWLDLRAAIEGAAAPDLYRGAVAGALLDRDGAETHLRAVIASAPQSDEADQAYEALMHLYLQTGRYAALRAVVDARVAAFPGRQSAVDTRTALAPFLGLPDQTRVRASASMLRHDGDLRLPVSVNGHTARFFWDTGAGISAMSEAEARRLGLEIRDERGKIGTITGRSVGLHMAVARELTIGDITLRDVSFGLTPDDQEPWSTAPLGQRGLLGVPVLVALHGFRWSSDGTVRFGAVSTAPGGAPNLYFDNDHLVVAAVFQGRPMPLTLDTGALTTDLDTGFAEAYPDLIASGTKVSREIRGVGHAETFEGISLPELAIRVGGIDTLLRPAVVAIGPRGPRLTVGNLGLDLLRQSRAFTVDFDSMTIALESR